jgi:hypothetical protein
MFFTVHDDSMDVIVICDACAMPAHRIANAKRIYLTVPAPFTYAPALPLGMP